MVPAREIAPGRHVGLVAGMPSPTLDGQPLLAGAPISQLNSMRGFRRGRTAPYTGGMCGFSSGTAPRSASPAPGTSNRAIHDGVLGRGS
jgi:hypothetical protein